MRQPGCKPRLSCPKAQGFNKWSTQPPISKCCPWFQDFEKSLFNIFFYAHFMWLYDSCFPRPHGGNIHPEDAVERWILSHLVQEPWASKRPSYSSLSANPICAGHSWSLCDGCDSGLTSTQTIAALNRKNGPPLDIIKTPNTEQEIFAFFISHSYTHTHTHCSAHSLTHFSFQFYSKFGTSAWE